MLLMFTEAVTELIRLITQTGRSHTCNCLISSSHRVNKDVFMCFNEGQMCQTLKMTYCNFNLRSSIAKNENSVIIYHLLRMGCKEFTDSSSQLMILLNLK